MERALLRRGRGATFRLLCVAAFETGVVVLHLDHLLGQSTTCSGRMDGVSVPGAAAASLNRPPAAFGRIPDRERGARGC